MLPGGGATGVPGEGQQEQVLPGRGNRCFRGRVTDAPGEGQQVSPGRSNNGKGRQFLLGGQQRLFKLRPEGVLGRFELRPEGVLGGSFNSLIPPRSDNVF